MHHIEINNEFQYVRCGRVLKFVLAIPISPSNWNEGMDNTEDIVQCFYYTEKYYAAG